MIIDIVRVMTAPWTTEDSDIVMRLPSWLRADYKISDRCDAEYIFACCEDKASQTRSA